MTDKEKLEQILQSLSELTETVREHKHEDDEATIDYDRLELDMTELVDAQVELKMQEREDATPVRKGEFVGPDGWKVPSMGLVENGKFAGQKMSDVFFARNLLERCHDLSPRGSKNTVQLPSEYMEKLLTATGTGTGDEFVPTGMAAEMWQDTFVGSRVMALLGVIPMPTDPFDLPLSWGSITWRKGAAGEASAAQDPATAKATLTATEQIAEVNWNYDLDEDGIMAVLPTLRSELTRSAGEQMDAFCINADATLAASGNINLNDDTPDTDSYYLSNGNDGIRHFILVDKTAQSTNISTTLTDALWIATRGRMAKWGINVARMALITNVKTYLQSIIGLTNVRTLDKYGPAATILNGELAKLDGIPVVASESVPLAGDDGFVVASAASNDEGTILVPNLDAWKVGFRRQLLIEIDRDIQKRIFIMVVSFRIAIAARNLTDTHTAGVHGITY